MQARVKFFSDPKGFGFARPVDAVEGDRDIFIHFSEIQVPGFKTVDENDLIECDVVSGPKGRSGKNVVVLEKAIN
jgi:CspA family cold shock protein